MNTDIRVDDRVVRDALKNDARQAPFALSLALNNVTKDAQAAIREGYKQRFTLRRPDFLLREGVKITKFATKHDQSFVLQVTEKAAFLRKFEEGEDRLPETGASGTDKGRAIAIPVNVRRTKRDIVPQSLRPAALFASSGAAKGRIFSSRGALVQRVRRAIRVLYIWKPRVRTPRLLKFNETAQKTVDKNWSKRALEAVDRALATRR